MREFNALNALHQAGLTIAPHALLLDIESYNQPVVVQSWIDGNTLTQQPQTDAEWERLIECLCQIHTIKQSQKHQIADAVLSFRNSSQGKARVVDAITQIPTEAQLNIVKSMLNWFSQWEPPAFPEPQLALCHSDPNWRNFISHDNRLYVVDWENSGWGDPAFEIADMITHPAYEGVREERWEFVIQTYVQFSNDPSSELRIRIYTIQMLMWWIIRSNRYLYEIPLGLDNRLVSRPKNWEENSKSKLAGYVDRMKLAIAQL